MDTAGLRLACQFALSPNILGYCGSKMARLEDCVEKGMCDHVVKELKKFIVLYPYLKTLAEITGKKPFDYDVVEAYWLGNDLLKMAGLKHYKILLKNFRKQGVPVWLLKELKNNPPKKFIPTHAFQVLFIGVGRASGSVPFNLKTVNNCLITNKNGFAYHWRKKIRALTKEEQKNLAFWTKEVQRKVVPLPKT